MSTTIKVFELRDHGTFIPLLCIKPQCDDHPFVAKMAWRFGYRGSRAVIALHMGVPDRGCQSDPFGWNDRTFQTAHRHIEEHWDELRTGDLIDVRVLLGETKTPCPSEAQ